MSEVNFPIDVVITWVNEDDPKWREKKQRFTKNNMGDKSTTRYRDYGTLRYVFRSIEKNAPWVNKIFLITDHQIPSWLDVSSSKVVLINHEDYIEKENLPTFNSNVIDLFFDKIKELSEHFVYFNDDMFVNRQVSPSDFFTIDGKPRDVLGLNMIMPTEDFDHIYTNNMSIINQEFPKRYAIRKNLGKFFNVKNFEWNLLTLLQLPWPRFSRICDPHVPISYLKSSITNVMEKYPMIRNNTEKNRFRSKEDYSLWVVRYFQLLNGSFKPRNAHFGKGYKLGEYKKIVSDIQSKKHALICINDDDSLSKDEFDFAVKTLKESFATDFQFKSDFEKC
jgi:hypothetical protein